MAALFESLGAAVAEMSVLALAAAFAWGVLSIVLSPCHLASIPLVVAFINGQRPETTRRAAALASVFALGILVTVALIGVLTGLAGRILGDLGAIANYGVAVIFLLVGLHLLGVIPMPWSGPGQVGGKHRGLAAAFILGLVFGLALGPCTFAFMAPLLAVVFKVASTQAVFGVLLLLCYGLGHCAVIAAAGTSTNLVQRYLDWDATSRATVILRRVCGVLICAAGVYLIYVAP